VREFRTLYGVPSSFGGITLPGSHEGGVYVDARRTTGRVEGEWERVAGRLRSLSARGNYTRFEQRELERGGFVGTHLGQLAASGEVVARFEMGRHEGAVGSFAQWRDFRAEGSYTGTRPAVQRGAALFAFDEVRFDPLRLLVGVRFDRSTTAPFDSTESQLLRGVRTRSFDALTGSLAATYTLAPGVTAGASVARAFRAPAIEELYSAGPHLAGYAYEVGNPELRAEVGHGADAFLRVERTSVVAEVSAFRNDVRDFIRYAPVVDPATGLPLRDPRLRRYVVYRPTQSDARLVGAEGKVEWAFAPSFALDATASAVWGTRKDGVPLADMPPLRGRLALRRETPRVQLGASLDAVAAQRRTPTAPPAVSASCAVEVREGEAELLPADYCPTPGYALIGVHAGRRWSVGRQVFAATLSVDNLFDTPWRDHLWRAKQVALQPGRNVKLVVRVMR
jgi:iron complex outermembrane receptor protein